MVMMVYLFIATAPVMAAKLTTMVYLFHLHDSRRDAIQTKMVYFSSTLLRPMTSRPGRHPLHSLQPPQAS